MKWSIALTMSLSSLAVARRLGTATCPSLEWSDEFDDPSAFDQSWTHQVGDGCDISQDLCGWGNSEWEWYQPENTVIQNSLLSIKADFDGQTRYTSSRIRTKGKVAVDLTQPRYIEAKIKVAGGQGIWPAFWMMPDDLDELKWPAGGEIDIMEYIGREPHNAHGFLHYGNQWNDRAKVGGPLTLPDLPPDQFRTYAIEKTANRITFLIDGYRYQSYSADDIKGKFEWPFERPFYLLLNVAIGGLWPGNPDDSTIFPTTMDVDYIRVYDISQGGFGAIEGTRLVHEGQTSVKYCLVSDAVEYTDLVWTSPSGSSIRLRPQQKCALVDFGSESGYVQVTAQSNCGERTFRMPVDVQPYFYTESTLVKPNRRDKAALVTSTGAYRTTKLGRKKVVQYQRDSTQLYDNIIYSAAINAPGSFVQGSREFYMDIKAETVAPCTEVLIQLEDSSLATPENWPTGRHSRYSALIQNTGDWERLEFKFVDRPDASVSKVDQVVVLFDPTMLRGDKYFMAKFDIASPSGGGSVQPLSNNQCRTQSRSEAGACADGINNDEFAYSGEHSSAIDCADADCWDDPVCQNVVLSEEGYCSDGVDQDGDGMIDCDDPDCANDPACGTAGAQSALCAVNARCVHLADVCCPTKDGTYLDCCD